MQPILKSPNIPTRFVLGSNGQFDQLCCPVCACPYVHPAEVSVEQGRTKAVISNENVQVTSSERFLHARGSRITLDFWCEFGHAFQYVHEFHKGMLETRLLTGLIKEPGKRQELWRD
jgi:hypothetical protein